MTRFSTASRVAALERELRSIDCRSIAHEAEDRARIVAIRALHRQLLELAAR